MGRLLGADELATYAELLTDEVRSGCDREFDALAPDADEATRQDLAERMLAELVRLAERFPDLARLGTGTPVGPQRYRETLERAIEDVYNPAQVDVLRRMRSGPARTS